MLALAKTLGKGGKKEEESEEVWRTERVEERLKYALVKVWRGKGVGKGSMKWITGHRQVCGD